MNRSLPKRGEIYLCCLSHLFYRFYYRNPSQEMQVPNITQAQKGTNKLILGSSRNDPIFASLLTWNYLRPLTSDPSAPINHILLIEYCYLNWILKLTSKVPPNNERSRPRLRDR